jgi:hypothetical protein
MLRFRLARIRTNLEYLAGITQFGHSFDAGGHQFTIGVATSTELRAFPFL